MELNLQLILIAVPVLALSIAFHEMMHALVSDSLGDDTARRLGRVTVNPLSHIDPITTVALPLFLLLAGLPPFGAAKPVPFHPGRVRHGEFGVALVALAGPLTNLFLAVLVAVGIRIFSPQSGGLVEQIMVIALQINVGFFIFNMIPFPPLDGSRVLYAFAPEPLQRFMEQIESLGFMAIAIFMFLFFPLLSPILGNLTDALLKALL